jgi:RNA polymerase sigma factor (sigma-70 family)
VQSEPDERLVALARLGHEAAFQAIVERYRPLLASHCQRVLQDSRAQDAVQQALLDAWSALRGGCTVRDLRPWLFTIAHRAALQQCRKGGERSDELPESLAGGRSPAEHAEQSARTRETFAAIVELPPAERDALIWTAVHGCSGRDTAHALGVSESAVRQLVFRARARARAAVRVFVPPLFSGRLGDVVRRTTALTRGSSSACSPETSGMLSKVVAAVAAGTLLGAPVVATHLTHHHSDPAFAALISRGLPGPITSTEASASHGARAPTARASLNHRPAPVQVREGIEASVAPIVKTSAVRVATPTAAPQGATGASLGRLVNGPSSDPTRQRVMPPAASGGQLPKHVNAPIHQNVATAIEQTAGPTHAVQGVTQIATGAVQGVTQMATQAVQTATQTPPLATQVLHGVVAQAVQQTASQAVQGVVPALAHPQPGALVELPLP